MARVNLNILGISEQKWIGIGEFNSDELNFIYYCGQESLKRNGVAVILNKRARNALVFECNVKNDRMNLVHFQSTQFSNTVLQVYALTTNAKEAEVEQLYEDLQDPLEYQKNVLFTTGN